MIMLFALLVLVEVKSPNRFNWKDVTHGHNDYNPFGAALVDSLLAHNLKNGYEVKPGSVEDAYKDFDHTDAAILLAGYEFSSYYDDEYDDEYIDEYNEDGMLLDILRRGQTVIIFSDSYLNDDLSEILDLEINTEYYSSFNNAINNDTTCLEWVGDSLYDGAVYRFRLLDSYMSFMTTDYNYRYCIDDSIYTCPWKNLILTSFDNSIIAASRYYEGGKIIFVSYPKLFTNYYLLEDGGACLLLRILSQAGDVPIIRYDKNLDVEYIIEANKSQSPLRVFLDNKSLRWAIYLTLIAIVLSIIFTARRKQRIIPLVKEPKNQNIEMVKHIGLMFYRSHDNVRLVREKYSQLEFELMRKRMIDISDNLDKDQIDTLAELAGLSSDKFKQLLQRIKQLDNESQLKIRNKETKHLINVMNSILKKI